MKKPGYYSTGELMKLAHITKKTVRYYDEHGILRPSLVTEAGARFYTDADLAKLQQILLFKHLGFSLSEIHEMTLNDSDTEYMSESLKMQLKLVEDRIEQLQVVATAIKDTERSLRSGTPIDWSTSLKLLHNIGMESSLKNQYQNASNISARINLHHLYATNKTGWFPWLYEQCGITSHMNILEVGCGDGTFWKESFSRIPKPLHIVLSDISDGMLRDVRRGIGNDARFSFMTCDCEKLPYEDDAFDLVIANHVLFYCENTSLAVKELYRVLKPGGRLMCSTYGRKHMKEISTLVRDFDDRIVLAAGNLYDRFGKENGADILGEYFDNVMWSEYEDELIVPDSQPLIAYILSCHGNQNQYISEHFNEFKSYVKKHVAGGFHISKEAGVFISEK